MPTSADNNNKFNKFGTVEEETKVKSQETRWEIKEKRNKSLESRLKNNRIGSQNFAEEFRKTFVH